MDLSPSLACAEVSKHITDMTLHFHDSLICRNPQVNDPVVKSDTLTNNDLLLLFFIAFFGFGLWLFFVFLFPLALKFCFLVFNPAAGIGQLERQLWRGFVRDPDFRREDLNLSLSATVDWLGSCLDCSNDFDDTLIGNALDELDHLLADLLSFGKHALNGEHLFPQDHED